MISRRHGLVLAAAGSIALSALTVAPASAAGGTAGLVLDQRFIPVSPAPASPVIAGINPGGAPWVLDKSTAAVRTDGAIKVRLRGLVIPTPPLNGTNPVASVVATLVCNGAVVDSTDPFALSTAGNGATDDTISVPVACPAPRVLIQPAANRAAYISATIADVPLPTGYQPEGITSGFGFDFYAGSVADGRIWKGSLRTGTGSVLVPAVAGRSLRGLYFDGRTQLVWAVGSQGTSGFVIAVDSRTGAVRRQYDVPGALFLNDLVISRGTVWVTDSQVDRLIGLPLTAAGAPATGDYRVVPLSGDWPTPEGLRANGIRALPDGNLILNNSTAGGLYVVSPVTGVATSVPVRGAEAVVSGDGLVLRGSVLYNVRGNGASAVQVIDLVRKAGTWYATVRGDITDPTLDVPSTATLNGSNLWAVNARFGVADPTTADFYVTQLPLRP